MTGRRAKLNQFWIGLKGGLLDKKHIDAMGDAVWMFGYLILGQTSINDAGEGVFQYGHPWPLEHVRTDLQGVSLRTIQRWIIRLRRTGYIRTESHGPLGFTFWIAKGKDKTKKPKVTTKVTAKSCESRVENPYANRVSIEKKSIRESRTDFQESIRDLVKESLQPAENTLVAAPIPKGFTPTNLFYYNKPAAAKSAAVIFPVSDLREEKRQPQEQPPCLGKTKRGIWDSPEQRAEAYRLLAEEKAQREARKAATA